MASPPTGPERIRRARENSKTQQTRRKILKDRFGGKAIIAVSKGGSGYTAAGKEIDETGELSPLQGKLSVTATERKQPRNREYVGPNPYTSRFTPGVLRTTQGDATFYTPGMVTPQGAYLQGIRPDVSGQRTQTTWGGSKAEYINIDLISPQDAKRAGDVEREQLRIARGEIGATLIGTEKDQARQQIETIGIPTASKTDKIITQTLGTIEQEKLISFQREAVKKRNRTESRVMNIQAEGQRLGVDTTSLTDRQTTKFTNFVDKGITDLAKTDINTPAVRGRVVQELTRQGEIRPDRWEAITGIPKELGRIPGETYAMIGSRSPTDTAAVRAGGMFGNLNIRQDRLPRYETKPINTGGLWEGLRFQAKTTPATISTGILLLATPLAAKGTRPLARTVSTRFYTPKITGVGGFVSEPVYNPATGLTTRSSTMNVAVRRGFRTYKIQSTGLSVEGKTFALTKSTSQVIGKPKMRVTTAGTFGDVGGVRVGRGVAQRWTPEGNIIKTPYAEVVEGQTLFNSRIRTAEIPRVYGGLDPQRGVRVASGITQYGVPRPGELAGSNLADLSTSYFRGRAVYGKQYKVNLPAVDDVYLTGGKNANIGQMLGVNRVKFSKISGEDLTAPLFKGVRTRPSNIYEFEGVIGARGARREVLGYESPLGKYEPVMARERTFVRGVSGFNLKKLKLADVSESGFVYEEVIGNLGKAPPKMKDPAANIFSDVSRKGTTRLSQSTLEKDVSVTVGKGTGKPTIRNFPEGSLSDSPALKAVRDITDEVVGQETAVNIPRTRNLRKIDLYPGSGTYAGSGLLIEDLGQVGAQAGRLGRTSRISGGLNKLGIGLGGLNIARPGIDIGSMTAIDNVNIGSTDLMGASRLKQPQGSRYMPESKIGLDIGQRTNTRTFTFTRTLTVTKPQTGTINIPSFDIPPPIITGAPPVMLPFGGGGGGIGRIIGPTKAKGRYTRSVETLGLGLGSTKSYRAAISGLGRR